MGVCGWGMPLYTYNADKADTHNKNRATKTGECRATTAERTTETEEETVKRYKMYITDLSETAMLFAESRRMFGLSTPWLRLNFEQKACILNDSVAAGVMEGRHTFESLDMETAVIAIIDSYWQSTSATKRASTVHRICMGYDFESVNAMLDAIFTAPRCRRFHEPCQKCKHTHPGLYMQTPNSDNCDRFWRCPCAELA